MATRHVAHAAGERGKAMIPFTRHFYEYTPLRPLEEIQAEILGLEAEMQLLLKWVMT
jgi:hypothetical protein